MRKKTLKKMERKLFVKKTGKELSKSEEGNTEKEERNSDMRKESFTPQSHRRRCTKKTLPQLTCLEINRYPVHRF